MSLTVSWQEIVDNNRPGIAPNGYEVGGFKVRFVGTTAKIEELEGLGRHIDLFTMTTFQRSGDSKTFTSAIHLRDIDPSSPLYKILPAIFEIARVRGNTLVPTFDEFLARGAQPDGLERPSPQAAL